MNRFIGIWQNEIGNKLLIKKIDEKKASVTFISGKTNEPIGRPYADNKLTIDMNAELDYYGSSVEVELWEKGKGFMLCLIDNDYKQKAEELSVGISRIVDEKFDFLVNYYHLFEPLSSYKRVKM
ncbi:hypothetical protein Q73A0000_05535 [Kaistella flava (ex Peng et al. 2021)]|uniref:Lipocalin-like domain-containing protein n=1 Tax=Kaistella flava (ex Peng et al. 2021) TaxID=2038776 RepID=A0A7M2Y8Y1_9FLAO|nr:hypothetical protein [Kaistella flava (ex Peng et al. 2021)]QOW09862.1 hypothetical protein Q73A0000_05535 [Kaistella flava (ex Peng et al. 2021)]